MSDSHPPATPTLGARRYSFAVIADTHLEPARDSGVARSNHRTAAIVAAVNRRQPAFVVHLGDIVHPPPSLPAFDPAAEAATALFAGIRAPLFYTPGNHDIGDKPIAWMPAKTVTAEWLDRYAGHFGAQWQSFRHHGDLHVLFNTPLLNSGLPAEAEQRAWLERELAGAGTGRVFLFSHYPPYLREPGEPTHYDNVDEPARTWLLKLIEAHAVEAVFSGHVHFFFYNRHAGTDCYALPSPAFVRRDFSELFRVAPGPEDEFGRNDVEKLGFLMVHVHERGHVVHLHRLQEVEDESGRAGRRRLPLHPREALGRADSTSLGVQLRHPWAEATAMPNNAPTDEFDRKVVRNDYPLLALWDMGVRRLRVPLADLTDPDSRARMRSLVAQGQRFTVFSVGAPDRRTHALLEDHGHLAAAWEIVLPVHQAAAALPAIAAIRRATGLPTRLARLRTAAESGQQDGVALRHTQGYGFHPAEREAAAALLDGTGMSGAGLRAGFDAVVVRLPLGEDAWDGLVAAAALARALAMPVAATICLSPNAPDLAWQDDAAIADRVATAAFAAFALGAGAAETGTGGGRTGEAGAGEAGLVGVDLDTFLDIDRGYFTRNGLVDRRTALRPAGRVLRSLHAALAELPAAMPGSAERLAAEGGDALAVRLAGGGRALLLLPKPGATLRVPDLPADARCGDGSARALRLDSGAESGVGWTVTGERLRLGTAGVAEATLVVV